MRVKAYTSRNVSTPASVGVRVCTGPGSECHSLFAQSPLSFSELCDVLGRGAEERSFDNEEGRTVNSGPGDVLRPNSLLPRQNACLDDPIQSRTEQLEGVEPALACFGASISFSTEPG